MADPTRRPLVAGNWKMNGLKASAAELTKVIQGAAGRSANVDLLVCPPATLVMAFAAQAHGSRVAVGGQDCHAEPPAPSPAMSRPRCWRMPAPRR